MKKNLARIRLTMLVFVLSVQVLFAQAIFIKGKVVDVQKKGLPGVNVTVKGTGRGTVTDINGNYSVSVSGKDVLLFSYIGFTSKEIKPSGQTIINVTLEENTKGLDEVVVVGYGQMKKRDLTGSIAQLKPTETEAAKMISVDNMLQGRIAGVDVTSSSATPGAAVSVQIRGANSLRGDNQPLYVIDNIPQSSPAETGSNAAGDFQVAQNPLTSLNPQDIASIEVLKDASATAIYGSRGANGVILITTKKGISGKANVSFNANYTVANPYKYLNVLGLNDYANYINSKGYVQYYFGQNTGGQDEVRLVRPNTTYDAADPLTYNVLTEKNWQKEIFRTAISQNYGLTVSGGNDKSTYYISAAFKDINGLVKATGMQQGDLRINLTNNISKSLKLTTTINGSIKRNNMMSGGDSKGGASGSIVRAALDYAPHIYPDDNLNNMLPESRSTVLNWLTDYQDVTTDNTFRASSELNWKINNWLTYSLRGGGNIRFNARDRWWGLGLFKGMNANGYLSSSKIDASNYTVENVLSANKYFSRNFTLSAVGGVTYDEYNFLNTQLIGQNFSDYSLGIKGMHLATVLQYVQPIQKDYQLMSYLGRVNLSFMKGRYLLTGSVRSDGSSKFAKDNRWSIFPSASVAWRMEEESWLKSVKFVDQMKLRLGWGMTGNQGIDPYMTLSDYSKNLAYATNTGTLVNALTISRLSNEGLKWEATRASNAGLDFSFFKQRITGNVDLYYKRTNQLLINKELAPSVGFDYLMINQGAIDNKGIELTVNTDVVRTKNLTWSVGGNIGINKSWISSLGLPQGIWGTEGRATAYTGNTLGDQFGPANIFMLGKAPGLFYGYKTNGIIQNADDTKNPTNGKVIKYVIGDNSPGNIKLVDQDHNDTIDVRDKTILGNPTPKFTYGFRTNVTYKNVSFSASFNGKYGNKVLNTNTYYNGFPGKDAPNILQKVYKGAWISDGSSNVYPSSVSNRTKYKANILDTFIEDGSYLRLSDVTFTYSFPKKLLKQLSLQKVNLYVTGQNLWILTKYTGFDPEVNSFAFDGLRMGIDMNGFPNPRSFVAGVNVTF